METIYTPYLTAILLAIPVLTYIIMIIKRKYIKKQLEDNDELYESDSDDSDEMLFMQ